MGPSPRRGPGPDLLRNCYFGVFVSVPVVLEPLGFVVVVPGVVVVLVLPGKVFPLPGVVVTLPDVLPVVVELVPDPVSVVLPVVDEVPIEPLAPGVPVEELLPIPVLVSVVPVDGFVWSVELPVALPVEERGVAVELLLPRDGVGPERPSGVPTLELELAPGVPTVEVLEPVLWSVPSVPLAPVVVEPL